MTSITLQYLAKTCQQVTVQRPRWRGSTDSKMMDWTQGTLALAKVVRRMNNVAASHAIPKFATPSIKAPPAKMKSIAAQARPSLLEMKGVAQFIVASEQFSATRRTISQEGVMAKSFRKKSGTYFKLIDPAICVPPHIISVHMGTSHCFRTPHLTSCVQSGNERGEFAGSLQVGARVGRNRNTAGSTKRYPTKPALRTFCNRGTDQPVSVCRFTRSKATKGPIAVPNHESISLRLRRSVLCSGKILSIKKTCKTWSKVPFTSDASPMRINTLRGLHLVAMASNLIAMASKVHKACVI